MSTEKVFNAQILCHRNRYGKNYEMLHALFSKYLSVVELGTPIKIEIVEHSKIQELESKLSKANEMVKEACDIGQTLNVKNYIKELQDE